MKHRATSIRQHANQLLNVQQLKTQELFLTHLLQNSDPELELYYYNNNVKYVRTKTQRWKHVQHLQVTSYLGDNREKMSLNILQHKLSHHSGRTGHNHKDFVIRFTPNQPLNLSDINVMSFK